MSWHRKALRSVWHRSSVGAVAFAVLLLSIPFHPRAADASLPSAKAFELKAAYLYNFMRFTSWPASSFSAPGAPLVVGIVGNPSMALVLERLVKDQVLNGHRIEVRTLDFPLSVDELHVLYVDVAQEAPLSTTRDALTKKGLLTVGESDRFLSEGGMIRLLVEHDRLLFEVNTRSSQDAGLALSSQLLALARRVE